MSREEFNEKFLGTAFPDWLRSTKESHSFRGYVLDKHTILEHFMDLLITAYFFGNIESDKSEEFINAVLANIDYSKKVKILEELKLINQKEKGVIFKVNDYRVAQSHIKKNDPLRNSDQKNWDKFQEYSINAYSLLASKIMLTDSDLREKVKQTLTPA